MDLNADLGEGFGRWTLGDDAALLDIVTSANVACGFHAGDPTVLLATCKAAVRRGVAIGAHVAYRDLAGFGRNFIDVPPATLYADVLYQLAAITGVARSAGGRVTYVKPHGALYNAIVHHEAQAEAVVGAIGDFDDSLALLGLPGSYALRVADASGLRTVAEAFADRAYNADGTLVSRRLPGAVLHDPDAIADRVVQLALTGQVETADGEPLELQADSVCVHGDSPGALDAARAIRDRLDEAGVELAAFA